MHSLIRSACPGWKVQRILEVLKELRARKDLAKKNKIPAIQSIEDDPDGILPNGHRPDFVVTLDDADRTSVAFCVIDCFKQRPKRWVIRKTLREIYGKVDRAVAGKVVALFIFGNERADTIMRKVIGCIRIATNSLRRINDRQRFRRKQMIKPIMLASRSLGNANHPFVVSIRRARTAA